MKDFMEDLSNSYAKQISRHVIKTTKAKQIFQIILWQINLILELIFISRNIYNAFLIIIIIICWQHRFPWLSLAIHPNLHIL